MRARSSSFLFGCSLLSPRLLFSALLKRRFSLSLILSSILSLLIALSLSLVRLISLSLACLLSLSLRRASDERVKVTNEALQGIRAVKFNAWEDAMIDKIQTLRNIETDLLGKNAYLRAASRAYMGSVPLFTVHHGLSSISSLVLFLNFSFS